jgi:hypothetical protein
MVETIAPVVYGRRRDYWIAVLIHTLAAGSGGAAFGALLGTLGVLLGAPWGAAGLVVIGGAGVIYAAREWFRLPVPLFDRKRQVPDWWRTFYSPFVAAWLYGGGLGIGFLTFLTFGTYVVVVIVALSSGDPLLGAILGAIFGATRGLATTVAARTKTEDEAAAVVFRLQKLATRATPRIVNGAACATIAAVALGVLAT